MKTICLCPGKVSVASSRSSRARVLKFSRNRIDFGKIEVTPLPRRNDDLYMRGVRRRRA